MRPVSSAALESVTTPADISPRSILSPRALVLLWILSGVVLLIGLGNPPVSRTQEARVLETARQMIGTGYENWLIPKLNGHIRLQKPPLP